MKSRFTNWLSRWRLRRIVLALHRATSAGLKPAVVRFAESLEATSMMTRGMSMKKDTPVTITATREELDTFIAYMMHLHSSKLSLLYRAKIGLATLALGDKIVLGETPEEFVKREKPKAKSSKDDKRIQLIR